MLLPLLLLVGGAPVPARLFSDHMVLQRETRAPIWGRAEAGERLELRVSWAPERRIPAVADAQGRWRAELETPAAGGPFEIQVRGATGTCVLTEVLVGEVWLASGQSNMEWPLDPGHGGGVEGWEEVVQGARDPELRVFGVANTLALEPATDVTGEWLPCTPESAPGFSAVAYFFARELRRELGVPVGVISAEWGGTPAEAWTSAAGLADFPEFAPELARAAEALRDPGASEARRRAEGEAYWLRSRELDRTHGLVAPELEAWDDSDWSTVELPTTFEAHGLEAFDGLVWYRRALELPAGWAGQELVIELGPIDDRDTVFWNGARIGGQEDDTAWQLPRHYLVPGEAVRAGRNVLVVRVLDTGGLGGFSGRAEDLRLTRPRQPGAKAEVLSLAGPWRWRTGATLAELGWPPSREAFGPGSPSVLWNGMVAPLVPAALRGVIWYQGEANRDRAAQYRRLFPALIRDWRRAFGQPELPFEFVQLAPFGYPGDRGQAAFLRDAQRTTLALPHTGMAVTMDIGDPGDIHPRKKREVGERLARLALAQAYGRELEAFGPLYRSLTVEGDTLRLAFAHAVGLTTRGEPVRHVTVAGADRVFHPAEARIEGEALVVRSPAVPAPLAVRFGWGAADGTNLWNAAGLPAASFRSDDWPDPVAGD